MKDIHIGAHINTQSLVFTNLISKYITSALTKNQKYFTVPYLDLFLVPRLDTLFRGVGVVFFGNF